MKIFTVITPRVLERINTIKSNLKKPKDFLRNFIIVSIFFMLLYFTFECTYVLSQIFESPFLILNFIFTVLFALTLFSGAIISINEFFVTNDLNIFLKSPIKNLNFYIGKILISLFSATWMPCLLLIPSLLALGVYYNQGILYYFLLPFLILPILTIPIFLGNIFVFIFSRLIPIKIFKEILFFIYSIMFVLIGILLKQLFVVKFSPTNEANPNALPFNWGANLLTNILLKKEFLYDNLLYLYISFIVLFFISFYIFNKSYFKILGALSSFSSQRIIVIKPLGKSINFLTNFLGTVRQEFIFKEFKTFFRNIGQTSQIFLLLGIVFLYFSNLDFILKFSKDYTNISLLLPIISFSLCAFILVAFCSRFIFPSLSLEAKAYDIFLKSPQNLNVIFNAKKIFWIIFLSVFSTVIFVSTAFVLNFTPSLVILSFLFGLLCSYGLTTITLFIGSCFLKLNWKNPYELCASVGSLCSMLFSIVYIVFIFLLLYFGFTALSSAPISIKIIVIFGTLLFFNIILSIVLTKLSLKMLKSKIML